MGIVLQVSNLSVVLDRKIIFEKINFALEEGQTLVVLGPNGAGKTVLLKALIGLLPYQGEVLWKKKTKIGCVPQRVPLNRDIPISVAEFFQLKKVSMNETVEILKQVGFAESSIIGTQLGLLSSGQFQRVLIAWALVSQPDILFFDEPTAGIDIGGEETIYDLLQAAKVKRNFSVILVTHDLSTVYTEATNVLCLNSKMSCYGPPEKILDPKNLQAIYGREIKYFRHSHG